MNRNRILFGFPIGRNIKMLGSKVFLPLTDAYGLLRCFATLVILTHSQYANLLMFSGSQVQMPFHASMTAL